MNKDKGFTLIELMIVIAIIAIIAAIAIPGLLSSQRGANERNASGSLKSTATAEVDFRQNDRDGNTINDFWVGDVQGLYVIEITANNPVKLIELPVARADAAPDATNYPGAGFTAAVGGATAKSGYWFVQLAQFEDNTGTAQNYANATDHNLSRFGIMAFPDDAGTSGNNVFIISEGNTMFKQDGSQLGMSSGGGSAGAPAVIFPNDPAGNSWSTLD